MTTNYGVEILHTESKGNVLIANRYFAPGETLLIECPALLAWFGLLDHDSVGRACGPFLKLTCDSQDSILNDFYCPLDSEWATCFRSICPPGEVGERMLRFLIIMQFNAVGCNVAKADGSGPDDSPELHNRCGLFKVASKMSHSCAPNAVWYTRNKKGDRVIRSTSSIDVGDEITISYMGETDLLLPMEGRRTKLFKKQGFWCNCARCATGLDDVRIFPCGILSTCTGTRRFTTRCQIGACSKCNQPCGDGTVAELLAEEEAISECLDHLDHIIDSGLQNTLGEQILALEPVHPMHYLTPRLSRILTVLHATVGDVKSVAVSQELRLPCWECVPALRTCQARAFDLEQVADAQFQAGNINIARSLYEESLAVLYIVAERRHPYVQRVTRKYYEVVLLTPYIGVYGGEGAIISTGDFVFTCALPDRKLNDRVGRVEAYRDGMYEVCIQGEVELLKAENVIAIQLASHGSSCIGDVVILYGLASPSEAALNGRVGILEEVGERSCVRLTGDGLKHVRQSNLAILPESPFSAGFLSHGSLNELD